MPFQIRPECPEDIDTIFKLTQAAFANIEYSSHTEQYIVHALRQQQALTLSLVALEHNTIVGHVAVSPVSISDGSTNWYGLGPISVWPEQQNRGIGSTLIQNTLNHLQALGAKGCVLLGDPGYYQRFGFQAYPQLILANVPPAFFQAICFDGDLPSGDVDYHPAFDAVA